MKQILALSLAASLAFGPLAKADVVMGQNEKYVVVEASEADCRLEGSMWEFLEAAHKLADIVVGFQEKFKGTPWDDLTEANEDEIRAAILSASRDFYDKKIKAEKKPKPVYNDPNAPAPTQMRGDFNINWDHARPSAMFFLITLKNIGASENPDLAKKVTESAQGIMRGGIMGALDPKHGGSIQVGIVMTPMCNWTLAKDPHDKVDPKDNNSQVLRTNHYQKAWAEKLPGEFERSKLPGRPMAGALDFEPFVVINYSGAVGQEFSEVVGGSRIEQFLHKRKPTIGFVWGDVKYARDVSGGFASINLNYGLKLPVPEKLGLGRDTLKLGVNNKWGCINNLGKTGPLPAPCDDYLFTSWRFAPPTDERMKSDGYDWSASASMKIYAGGMLAGVAGLQWALSFFGAPPEAQEEFISKFDWIIDRTKRYVPAQTEASPGVFPASTPAASAPASAEPRKPSKAELERDAIRRGGPPPLPGTPTR